MIGKHRPHVAGRLWLERVDHLLYQSVNISAVTGQPVSVGLIIRERSKLK
jgi:hypothetical protein